MVDDFYNEMINDKSKEYSFQNEGYFFKVYKCPTND